MNERVKLLAKQAGIKYSEAACGTPFYEEIPNPMDLEKFAELIVQECAEVANEPGARIPGYYIKKHFGVEE